MTAVEHSRTARIPVGNATGPASTVASEPELTHAEKLSRAQKHRNDIGLFVPRQLSKRLMPMFLWTGISANQATALWGVLSLMNVALIYFAIIGNYALIPVVFAVFFAVQVLDCLDGEIARYRGTASPIGGKLLDGAWHECTHFALLVGYVAGLSYWRQSAWLLPIGMALIAGEAMYTFVYERRLTAIRVFAKSTEFINPTSSDDMYELDERWRTLSLRKKLKVVRGLIWYKSVYFIIALSYVSADALFAGIVLLTGYKHFAWIRLLVRTMNRPPQPAST